MNLDGAVHFERRGVPNRQYTQIFRNGCVEMVTALPSYAEGSAPRISGHWLVANVVESIGFNLRALRAHGFDGPVVISLALVGIGGYALETHREVTRALSNIHQRFVLPDVLVDDANWNARAGLKDMFDVLWNAFGFEFCTAYNDDGSLRSA